MPSKSDPRPKAPKPPIEVEVEVVSERPAVGTAGATPIPVQSPRELPGDHARGAGARGRVTDVEQEGDAREADKTAETGKKPEVITDVEVIEDEEAASEEALLDEDDVLADVGPVTDEDIDAIARAILPRASATIASASSTSLAVRDPMVAYMADVRKHPLLSREEEHELAVRWIEHGDREAGRKLVTSNLRLVVKLANEYRRSYHNLLDLVQEGNLGLVRAVEKFDPYRGVKLSTYAGWWIRAFILKYILNNWSVVKIGTTQTQRKLFFNLRKAQERLRLAGVEATPDALARELDVAEGEVVEMEKRMSGRDSSLDAPMRSDSGDSRARIDILEGHTDADPEDHVGSVEFRALLHDNLRRFGATLEGRELEIFSERIVADEPITLQELGERWGVSRERARQVEKRMVLRLRAFLQSVLGDSVDVALGHDWQN